MNILKSVASFVFIFLLFVGSFSGKDAVAQSQLQTQSSLSDTSRFPPPEEVFLLDYQQIDHELTVTMEIPEGFYLYKERFDLSPKEKIASELELPEGIQYQDQFFGETVIYRDRVSFSVQLNEARRNEPLTLHYQGCADEGFCYPPSTQTIFLRQTNGVNSSQSSDSDTTDNENSPSPWLMLMLLLALPLLYFMKKKHSKRN